MEEMAMPSIGVLDRIAKEKLSCSSHDYYHSMRVLKMCKRIGTSEGANLDVLEAATLLHDIARPDENKDSSICHAMLGADMAMEILDSAGFPADFTDHVCHCIYCHRFRDANLPESIEAKILYDADKLDVLGAIGIGRAFLFGGQHGQLMHIPGKSADSYKEENISDDGRIKVMGNHTPIFEILLKIQKVKEKLYTKSAKDIAESRHAFIKNFTEEFLEEWDGLR